MAKPLKLVDIDSLGSIGHFWEIENYSGSIQHPVIVRFGRVPRVGTKIAICFLQKIPLGS